MDITTSGLPHPSETDPLSSWPQTLSSLVDILGARLPQTGLVTTSAYTLGTVKTTAITFPVPYPAGVVPRVFLDVNESANPDAYDLAANAVTNTGFELKSVRNSGTAGLVVAWMAVQP